MRVEVILLLGLILSEWAFGLGMICCGPARSHKKRVLHILVTVAYCAAVSGCLYKLSEVL